MATDKRTPPEYSTTSLMENNNNESTLIPNPKDDLSCPIDSRVKLKKKLQLYTTGCFYDVTFKVISDVADESKVNNI